jgi:DNA invertase Pin-like site-specific DNA recombinase
LALVWREGGAVYTAEDGEILRDDPDDPMRSALRKMVGVFAELDRKTLVKRMRDGRKAKAEAGMKATGAYAYGTQGVGEGRARDAGPNEVEQQAVTRIVELRKAGCSYRAVAATLDAEGHLTRRMATLKAKGETPEQFAGWTPMAVRNVALRAGCS